MQEEQASTATAAAATRKAAAETEQLRAELESCMKLTRTLKLEHAAEAMRLEELNRSLKQVRPQHAAGDAGAVRVHSSAAGVLLDNLTTPLQTPHWMPQPRITALAV